MQRDLFRRQHLDHPRASGLSRRSALATLLVVAAAGCGGRKALMPAGAGGRAGVDASGAAGAAGGAVDAAGIADASDASGVIGWGGVRRLTDSEYDNTMRDLLGVAPGACRAFARGGLSADVRDIPIDGFDNVAVGQNILPARYQWYFAAAVAFTDQVWADPVARARVVTCAPASPTDVDETCTRSFARAFGRAAWRRPLSAAEVEGLVALARAEVAAGADFATSLKQIAVALLASEAFLYRLELDPDPNAPVVHPVSAYELATRLSYLLWSSTPDVALLDAAEAGQLDGADGLRAQVQRLLADPRADAFVRDFAGQWLGFRALEEPERAWWPRGTQRAATEEARRFVAMIVDEDRPLSDLLTADVNFYNDALAQLYGFPPSGGDALVRVSMEKDARRGYIGMVAPLALNSHETNTSPSMRGTWVQSRLLCQALPGAHPNTPPPIGTGHQRVAAVAAMPACAACHNFFDPIGLGLERFDHLGRYHSSYTSGVPTEDLGTLPPSGAQFRGPGALGDLIAADPEYRRCIARWAITYALGRHLIDGDEAAVDRVAKAFEAAGLTARALLTSIVADDAFRLRRGEGTPQ